MPKEDRVVTIGLAVAAGLTGLVVALALYSLAQAAPPEVYTCPVCGDEFSTSEELQQHLIIEHPEAPIAQFAYVSDVRHYIQKVVDTNYEVFEVDVQNQGNITEMCSAIACCSYKTPDDWSDWEPLRYDLYRRQEAQELKVDSAFISPGQIVTFREALWKWAYRDLVGNHTAIYVKFVGEAGEILSSRVSL